MERAAVSCSIKPKKTNNKIEEVISNLAIANKISPDALLSDLDGSNDTLCY